MKIDKEQISDGQLLADTTVNFTSGMSAATIQALIDAQPKNLGGYTLTFQFADGTYALSAGLYFKHFYSGALVVTGNTGSGSTLHTNQAVILGMTGASSNAITFDSVSCTTWFNNIRLNHDSNSWRCGVFVTDSFMVNVSACYIVGNTTVAGNGVRVHKSSAAVVETYFTSSTHAIDTALFGSIFVHNNASTGTLPLYGLQSEWGGRITGTGTQPTGSNSNQAVVAGGTIDVS